MTITRRRSKFRVELTSYKPRVIRQFDNLNQLVVCGTAGNQQPGGFNLLQQHVVNFITVTMTFNNGRFAVHLTYQAIVGQVTLLATDTHRATQIAFFGTDFDVAVFVTPFGDQCHHRVLTVWHKLG
ncbi:hypothetical protein D3C78_1478320 [compost metagenome]